MKFKINKRIKKKLEDELKFLQDDLDYSVSFLNEEELLIDDGVDAVVDIRIYIKPKCSMNVELNTSLSIIRYYYL